MDRAVLLALAATTGTWFITALGAGTVVFFGTTRKSVLNTFMGFAAGVMIAASFWSLLLPAVEQAEQTSGLPPWLVITLGILFGALFMWLADRLAAGIQRRNGTEGHRRTSLLVLSITLHNIPEGLAVGVAFGALRTQGYSPEALACAIAVAVGIGLQNFPEGAAVSLPLRREGYSRSRSFLIGQGSAMVEPLFGVLGALLVSATRAILPYALSFAAGAMILVAVHELIPQCQEEQSLRPYSATMGILAGFTVMTLLDVALG